MAAGVLGGEGGRGARGGGAEQRLLRGRRLTVPPDRPGSAMRATDSVLARAALCPSQPRGSCAAAWPRPRHSGPAFCGADALGTATRHGRVCLSARAWDARASFAGSVHRRVPGTHQGPGAAGCTVELSAYASGLCVSVTAGARPRARPAASVPSRATRGAAGCGVGGGTANDHVSLANAACALIHSLKAEPCAQPPP